jgi:hypothetical protein
MKQTKTTRRFVVCVDPGDYPASLAQWKIYRLLPDPDAAAHGQVRVVDESGEDYLFPNTCFKPVRLPPELGRLFPRVGRVRQNRTASRRAQG